ncbi:c-type cytochrome [Neisseria sp. Ec49-e6-T10]|uniref:c-type cytochrome n=1 Tax=Neisseria sp. Ec49-e6-T10 TaxID=3140744 RepID=UPI003EB8A6EB
MNNIKNKIQGSTTVTVIGAIVILVIAVILLVRLATTGYHIDSPSMTQTAVDARLKPTGYLMLGDGVPAGQRTGEMVFNKVCFQCHAQDAKGQPKSPKMGNAAEWAPRIAQGYEMLISHAINGFMNDTMPARGGRSDLTDEEVARAIAYMANASGANFTPPPVEADDENAEASGEAEAASAE